MKRKKPETLTENDTLDFSNHEGVSILESGIHNTSEIGRLQKVMLHRPGLSLIHIWYSQFRA